MSQKNKKQHLTQNSKEPLKKDALLPSTKVSLGVVSLPQVVNVDISPNLYDEFAFLCSKIPSVEWSGTLFYTTEGSFGSPSFKIIAQQLFLQNIGTSGYTEYENDGKIAGWLMRNPHCLEWKKGHIHSHNTMGTFFSGTDMDELKENSEFHNYYFSLIVNNKHDLTAKVAFRGTPVNSTISTRGDNGEVTNQVLTFDSKEVVYTMDCNINLPQRLQNQFIDNYHKVVTEYNNSQKMKQLAEKKTPIGGGIQSAMFGGSNNNRTPASNSDGYYSNWVKPNEIPANPANSLGNVQSFVVKVLKQDKISYGSVASALSQLESRYFTDGNPGNSWGKTMDFMFDNIIDYYSDEFPDDPDLLFFDEVIDSSKKLIERYEEEYPTLVSDLLTEVFSIVLDDSAV